jgi:hypothetical protein
MTELKPFQFETSETKDQIENALTKLKIFVLDNIEKFDKLPENEITAIKNFFSYDPSKVANTIEEKFKYVTNSLNDSLDQIKAHPENQEKIVSDILNKFMKFAENKFKDIENLLKNN